MRALAAGWELGTAPTAVRHPVAPHPRSPLPDPRPQLGPAADARRLTQTLGATRPSCRWSAPARAISYRKSRFLGNYRLDSVSPLALGLVGRGEPRRRLRPPSLAALAQRVT
ncbi:MAG TPA: hypothetical protein DCM14_05070 [Clostridiales bacterium UBA8153]|nr:hypothetical protein [Clostridiales bacterium UBA8153]